MPDTDRSLDPSEGPSAPRKQSKQGAPALRLLAPKPLPPPRPAARSSTPHSSDTTSSRHRSPTACPVCYRVGCQLPTHTAFGSLSHSPSQSPKEGAGSFGIADDAVFTSSYAYKITVQDDDRSGSAATTGPVYQLPLEPDLNTSEMHQLFHSWFATEVLDFWEIPRPPEIQADLVCGAFLFPALQDSLLCLSVLAAAASRRFRRSGQEPRDVTSLTLLDLAIQRMRERVDQDPEHISDTTIAAAVFLWVIYIFMEDTDAMESQSGIIYAFVDARGGMDELGLSGAVANWIRWVDAFNSLILPIPCRYPELPHSGPPVNPPAVRYGSYWDHQPLTSGMVIEPLVVLFCQNTCRLVERLERAEADGITGSEYARMLQQLRGLYTDGSTFRARTYNRGGINECVSNAVTLIQIQCFCKVTKLNIMQRANVTRLTNAIKATGGPQFWQQDLDLFMWLLFIVVTTTSSNSDRLWCLQLLCRAVSVQFGREGDLQPQWRRELRNRFQSFVWCDARLDEPFELLCLAIQRELGDDMEVDSEEE